MAIHCLVMFVKFSLQSSQTMIETLTNKDWNTNWKHTQERKVTKYNQVCLTLLTLYSVDAYETVDLAVIWRILILFILNSIQQKENFQSLVLILIKYSKLARKLEEKHKLHEEIVCCYHSIFLPLTK